MRDEKMATRSTRRRPYLETQGLPPGSLVHTGERKAEREVVTLISYSEKAFSVREIAPEDVPGPDADAATVQWVNVEGLHDIGVLESIGNRFGLHRLVMESILNTSQRPKLEDYGKYAYAVVKVLSRGEDGVITTEQESLILGEGFVLTFAERDTGLFDPVVERLRNDVGRIRKAGADYLVYSLLDVIADGYFVALEDIGERIEDVEDEIVGKPTGGTLKEIYGLKRSLLSMHKAVWPFREVAGALQRGDTKLVRGGTGVYLRDLYDHAIQAMDITDTQRDMLSGMLDIYLTSASNRMGEIMKVLTIISTVFIPLTFIAGVYGMNLPNMPEMGLPWFYPALWGLMVATAAAMLYYFKRRKWW